MPVLFAAAFLFVGLGEFGLWEPQEIDRVNLGEQLLKGGVPTETKAIGGTKLYPGERLCALGWSLGGRSELAARLPLALLALITLLALQLLLTPLAGRRIAGFAAFAFAASPILLFHGRQVTSWMPLLSAETLSVGGLALVSFYQGRKSSVAGAALAVLGLALGWVTGGLLVGVTVPTATILLTLALNGDVTKIFFAGDDVPARRRIMIYATAAAVFLSVSGFVFALLSDSADIPWITGGIPAKVAVVSFSFSLERLAFGWFPWIAFVPVLLTTVINPRYADDPHVRLRLLAISGIVVGLVVHTFYVRFHGPAPLFLPIPVALAIALSIEDLESSVVPHLLGGLLAALLLAILLRDFAQRPEAILEGFGWSDLKAPKDFKPVIHAIIASIPFGVMVILAGFVGAGEKGKSRWRPIRARILFPLAAIGIGGYISMILVPQLSIDLSSKHVLSSYEKFAGDGEPLGVFGSAQLPAEATTIKTRAELLKWLERRDRVFALFPPKHLAGLDREYREKTGKHIFLLDAKSDRHFLAVSKHKSKEKNDNPIVNFVFSRPFEKAPRHKKEINLDNKITMLGWEVSSVSGAKHLERGNEFDLITYWRCDDKLSANWKVFIHIDGPGPRIHGDHEPVSGIYPTKEWSPGDYIMDVHRGKVPAYQEAGMYRINLGMYRGNTRMKVLDEPRARENAINIGKVSLK